MAVKFNIELTLQGDIPIGPGTLLLNETKFRDERELVEGDLKTVVYIDYMYGEMYKLITAYEQGVPPLSQTQRPIELKSKYTKRLTDEEYAELGDLNVNAIAIAQGWFIEILNAQLGDNAAEVAQLPI